MQTVNSNPVVSIRDLSKVYQTRRGEVVGLKYVSLDIMAGEMVVLLGPSGCGKTTLLRCVAGLEQPTTGEIQVYGRTVFSSKEDVFLPPQSRNLSMVFQSYALWPHMTVFNNVAYPLKVARVKDAEIHDRVNATLATTGLETFSSNYPGQLSGGQQQRVALARALVANDGLVLFDEPLSNLDAKVRERLRDELVSLQQQYGFTGVYVTHDQVEAAALANRIAVMEVGQVAQFDEPKTIFNAPSSRYVADFVGCTNEIRGSVVGSTGDIIHVDTPMGRMDGRSPTSGLQSGTPVIVMFRPEHGRISTKGAAERNRLTARIERSVFLGSHMEYQLTASGQELVIRSMDGDPVPHDQEIGLSVDPALVRVFPIN